MIFDKKLDAGRIRRDFPTLGKMIYADSACMSLKPRQVIEKMNEYYYNYPACAGRSAHRYGRKLEEEIARARKEIAVFIGAKEKEIIFTKNATEALNLAANGLRLKRGDEVIITDKEHSSNIIPWLKLKKEIGIKVVICNTGTSGIDLEELRSLINNRTKLISAVHVSNLDGMENDISGIVKIARKKGVMVMIDACQSAPHKTIDVKKIDCDFLAFSGHKMLGPTGTGVLYGKLKELEKLGMFIVGGETVLDATYEDYKPEEIPARFEAGLQNYSGIIGLGEACRYLKKVGMKNIEKHEKKLGDILRDGLKEVKGVEIIGSNSGVFNFNIKGMTHHEVAKILDSGYGIMVRSGRHCVHEWYNDHKIEGSVRASFYLYNTEEEAERFVSAVKEIARIGN